MNNPRRVLIVEDHPGILEKFKLNMSRAGMDVDTADTKEEALERIRRRAYHAAMIDVNLTDYVGGGGDRSGIDIVRKINELGEGTNCVVISGERSADIPVDAFEAGTVKYIIKKRIRGPSDYVDIVRDFADQCSLHGTGRYQHLNAYLARPEMRDIWESQAIRLLRCDVEGLNKVLADAFGPYLPVLPRKDAQFVFGAQADSDQLGGAFWSRARGAPIWISIARKGTSPAEPTRVGKVGSLLAHRDKGIVNFSVWALVDLARDDFLETAYDVA